MPDRVIWSAPEEAYNTHIANCLEAWNAISARMLPSFGRLFQEADIILDKTLKVAILCHDIGKLSEPWQRYIKKPKDVRKYGPPHATLGAAYLKGLGNKLPESCLNAAVLAILMHHTDSGLAQGNLEHPAEDAINRGIIKYGTEKIRWADGAETAFKDSSEPLASIQDMLKPLSSISLKDLEEMAKALRLWGRCPKELERHQRRIQALSIHHVLKVCDWRAADQRMKSQPEADEDGDAAIPELNKSILEEYLAGGLLP